VSRWRAWIVFAFVATSAASATGALADTLSYQDARAALHSLSDRREASEAAVSQRNYEARSADSLGLPEISVNATQVFGMKTGSISGTPLGTINISQNFNGPRSSVNATWSIYSGGRHLPAAQQRLPQVSTKHARSLLEPRRSSIST
jgi:hypothetical protein